MFHIYQETNFQKQMKTTYLTQSQSTLYGLGHNSKLINFLIKRHIIGFTVTWL